jgi:pyruvate/2-oxoglutarate/acetoin dehydrogenase E1 component
MSIDFENYKGRIADAMSDILASNSNAVVIGQGVSDPTGIFGTTEGLAKKYGHARVIDMAIMEEGMTGIAIGMALSGLYPIQTHIRVDFLMLAMNQIVNMAAKYRYMYDNSFEVPMLIRAIVGRSWGQGPQHSQSLQSLFSHIPGLTVIMPASAKSAYDSYIYAAKKFKNPVIAIEHRLLYDLNFKTDLDEVVLENPFVARLIQFGKDVTIVATSYMVQEAQRAALWVKNHANIECEIIDLHIVSNIDPSPILHSLKKTGRLLVADTSWQAYGVSAEICRLVMESDQRVLKEPVITLGMAPTPCPTSQSLEDIYYPDMSDIVSGLYKLMQRGGITPTKNEAKQMRKSFKGPF